MNNVKSKTFLYHEDIFMPDGVQPTVKEFQKCLDTFQFSFHLQDHFEIRKDRSHTYFQDKVEQCLESLKTTQRQAFEVEVTMYENNKKYFITKYCVRIPYSDTEDVCVAIRPIKNRGQIVNNIIVTAWMNSHNDVHTTLNKTKYCTKEPTFC